MTSNVCFGTLRNLVFTTVLLAALANPAQAQPDRGTQPEVKEIAIAAGAFSKRSELPDWVVPLAEIPPTQRSDAVVLQLAETQLLVSDRPATLIHRAVLVNEKGSLGSIGQFPINFNPDYQKLSLHALQIIRNGQAIDKTDTVNIRFLQRETGLEASVYSGTATAMLLLDDVRVGDVLRFAYSLEGINPVLGDKFSDMISWDYSVPVEQRRIVVSHDPTRKIRWEMIGDNGRPHPTPVSYSKGGRSVLQFEDRGANPVASEPNLPSEFISHRVIQFTEYEDWNSVADWARGLFPPKPELPAELMANLQAWRALPGNPERASAALKWVQEEIRYFSVSMGQSSHRPHSPVTVTQRRYGDCKDKAYLLVTLLREMGLDADPVLVSLQSPRLANRILPTPYAFDHVIVRLRIDGKTYYLDGTRLGQQGRLESMGWALPGASGLEVPVAGAGSGLLALNPDVLPSTYLNELHEEFSLDQFGAPGRLKSRRTFHGITAEFIRTAFPRLNPEQRRAEAVTGYERRYPGIRQEGETRLIDDVVNNVLILEAEYIVPDLIKEFRDDWVMRFFPGNMANVVGLPEKLTRNFPVQVFSMPQQIRYTMAARLPEQVAMISDPAIQRVRSDFFSAEVEKSFRGNVSNFRFSYSPRVEAVAATQLSKVLEDIRKMDRAIGGAVVVSKSAVKSAGFLGIGKATLQSNMRARLDKVIEATGKTLAERTLTGDDLAEVLCERAEALTDRGEVTAALKDAEQAVTVAPSLGRAHECRANSHFVLGNFQLAITGYTKALSLGADPFQSLYRRGHARFYAGLYEAAAVDFQKAAELKNESAAAGSMYARLWQVWALKRAGKPLPDDLVTLARKEAGGDWPRPALAMMVDALTPEQVLATLESQPADQRELNLVEGWFYIGQYHLSKGEPMRAREAFSNSRARQITMYIEHVAAGFEISKL